MSKVLKTIEMDLTPSSIDKAIREVRDFRKQLLKCCNDLVKKLTEEGVQNAKLNVVALDAIDTGNLHDSIEGVFFPQERMGVIYTPEPYALFVEYGTGLVGEMAKPHPNGDEIGWEYDVHHHGLAGWVYHNTRTGNSGWTIGMPARPYMYNTYRWLQDNAEQIASTVFQ